MIALALSLLIQVEDRFTLDNGLEVVLKPVARQDLVAVAIAYRAGVLNEPADRHGLAHLVEHLVFRGATASFKAGEAERLQIAAGPFGRSAMDANAETMHDLTYFYSLCPPDKLDQALKIEAERMRTVVFTPELLDEERAKAIQETVFASTNPAARAWQRAMELTYSKLRYRLAKAGSPEGMKAATVDDARAFYDAWYAPNNAVLVLFGKFDPAAAKDLVKARFGGIAAGKIPPFALPDEPDDLGERAILSGEPRQVTMTWLSAPWGGREKAALVVGIYRLLAATGTIGKYAEPAYIFDDLFARGRSAVTLTAVLKKEAGVDETVAAAQAWVDILAAKPLKDEGLEDAVARLRNDLGANDALALGFIPKNDPTRYAQTLAQLAINRVRREVAGADRIAKLLEEAEKVTPEDVVNAARKYLSRDRANVVIMK